MSKKDPAFLFYSETWHTGTAHLMPDEKGVFIDLLAFQHKQGAIPSDTVRLARMVGLPEQEFLRIWGVVGQLFVKQSDNRLVNRFLKGITSARATKAVTNKISGTFASLIRLCDAAPEIKEQLKNEFKIDDFVENGSGSVNQSVTEWFHIRLKSIININRNTNKDIEIGGVGERGFDTMPKSSDPEFKDLPESQVESAIEILSLTQQVEMTHDEIKSFWKIFKTQNLTGDRYYQSIDKVYNHFNNWVKDKKINKKHKLAFAAGRDDPHDKL